MLSTLHEARIGTRKAGNQGSVSWRACGLSIFLKSVRRIHGILGHCAEFAGFRARVFSYNKRTMDWVMGPFWPLWHFTESITYVRLPAPPPPVTLSLSSIYDWFVIVRLSEKTLRSVVSDDSLVRRRWLLAKRSGHCKLGKGSWRTLE